MEAVSVLDVLKGSARCGGEAADSTKPAGRQEG